MKGKLEVNREELLEIAQMYYQNTVRLETEILMLNALAVKFGEENPYFQVFWRNGKRDASTQPGPALNEGQRFQDSLNRVRDQLQQESLSAVEFLKYLVASGSRIVR